MNRRSLLSRANRAVALVTVLSIVVVATANSAAAQIVSGNPWSIGMDARLESQKPFSKLSAGIDYPRQTIFQLPTQHMRVGYRVSPMLEIEVPLALSIVSLKGASSENVLAGAVLNFGFATTSTLRPFIGAGGFATYRHANSDGNGSTPSVSTSATQLGARGQVGLEWYPFSSVSFRPTLFYEREFEKSSDQLPGYDTFGASVGATLHFGPQVAAGAAKLMPVQLSVGFAINHEMSGDIDGSSNPSLTALALPSSYVGIFVPVTPDARLMLGANLNFGYFSQTETSSHFIELQPRAEFNFNPSYRTQRSVRLGAQVNYETSSFTRTLEGSSLSSTLSQLGGGADLSLTFPFGGSVLYRAGLGFDYLGGDTDKGAPSLKTVSLKFGIDAR